MGLIFSDAKINYVNPFLFYRINIGAISPYASCHEEIIWDYSKVHVQSIGKHGIFGASFLDLINNYMPQFYNHPHITILELESGKEVLLDTDNNLSCEMEVQSCNVERQLDLYSVCSMIEDYRLDSKYLYAKQVIRIMLENLNKHRLSC